MSESKSETKVLYRDEGRTRAVRGILIDEDQGGFVVLERRDGLLKIRRELVLVISPAVDNGGY